MQYKIRNKMKNKIDKQAEIEKHLNTPYKVGEDVYVRGLGSQDKNAFSSCAKIEDINEGGVKIKEHGMFKWYPFEDLKKFTFRIGHDPFNRKMTRPRLVNFGLDSIISVTVRERGYKNDVGIEIQAMNWNPHVMINGKKEYYQRGFVWTLEDKQSFINSIYNEMDCGKIVIRKYSWDELAKQTDPEKCYFNEIIDGKQRLSTIIAFMNDEFPDSNGYLFSELSKNAQRTFESSQCVGYAEFNGYVSDEDILKQFLMINHTGVPQSKEHIDFVRGLLEDKIK